jgi:iron complex transport system ATP-binding protein
MLAVQDITCAYRHTDVIQGVSFPVPSGAVLGITGPNGSGKTTLLRALSRVHRPRSGRILLQGRDLYTLPHREVARTMAVCSQQGHVDVELTVEELVLMGRYPHLEGMRGERAEDFAAVQNALEVTGTSHLASRLVTTLSGGERQRVQLARALAQEPRLLMLDEPTAHLDIGFQVEIMDLVSRLNTGTQVTVVMVLHDLNLAARYCQRLVMLKEGRVQASGDPEQVLVPELLEAVYGIPVLVRPHPVYPCPQVLPLSRNAPVTAGYPGSTPVSPSTRPAP